MNIGLEYIKYRWNCWRRTKAIDAELTILIEICKRQSIDSEDNSRIEKLINELKINHNLIEVHDFGAGSKKLNNNRKISSILATSSSNGRYGKLLYHLARHYHPKNTLELGTSIGIGSIFLKMGFPNGLVTTVEACPNTHHVAQNNFRNVGIEINQVNSTFSDFLKAQNKAANKYDLIFIDGHHDGNAVTEYLNSLKDYIHEDSIIIVDDIRWSESMKKAWDSIVANQEFCISIDLFRMGIVMKKPHIEKTHCSLKL